METYSRIGLLRSYGNLQSYWTTTKLWKLTVVFRSFEDVESVFDFLNQLRYVLKTPNSILLIRGVASKLLEDTVVSHSKRVGKM
jgi:hypothetical protein